MSGVNVDWCTDQTTFLYCCSKVLWHHRRSMLDGGLASVQLLLTPGGPKTVKKDNQGGAGRAQKG